MIWPFLKACLCRRRCFWLGAESSELDVRAAGSWELQLGAGSEEWEYWQEAGSWALGVLEPGGAELGEAWGGGSWELVLILGILPRAS
jgi:hypothetical protein